MNLAAILSIVVTLALAPGTGLLCQVVCAPDGTNNAYHHRGGARIVSASNSCHGTASRPVGFLGEHVRRGAVAQVTPDLLSPPLSDYALTSSRRPSGEYSQHRARVAQRPLTIILRI
jgi:hypothetical protein